jgi:sugar O-acyltransferase (sialic acid O-acetyltransferase NeuD family)
LNKQIILIGGGGHAKVLVEILNHLGVKIDFLVAPILDDNALLFVGIERLKNDDDVLKFKPDEILLINGIGSLPGKHSRKNIFEKFSSQGFKFLTVISNQAIISPSSVLSEGVQIMPGVILNADVFVGENTIVNTGAIVEHDCKIGSHNHIAPGAVLCGSVSTGSGVHIGAGANVIQEVEVGDFSVVGAGVSLTKKLKSRQTVYSDRPFLTKEFL